MSHPDRVGKYQILGKIADGGMAEVFLAVQTGAEGFQKRVALKMILPYYVRDEAFVRSFVNEARICGLLTHPNLVQVYEFAREGEQLYLAMAFIEGLDLERVITHRKLVRRPLTPAVIAEIVLQMLEGLEYAHTARFSGKLLNVVHRDLKPSNVLIDQSGFVKIVDFGVAKASNNLYKTLNQGTAKGTVSYMSPEQATGKTDLGPASDLFSVGVILYEMLTGDRLFDGDNLFAILDDVRTAPLESKITSPRIPPLFQSILARALARDLSDRYPSATDMAKDIRSKFPDVGGPLLLARTVEQLRGEGLEVMGLQNDGQLARRRAQETLQKSAVSASGRAERVQLAGGLAEDAAEATEWKGRGGNEVGVPTRALTLSQSTSPMVGLAVHERVPERITKLAEAEITDPAQLRETRSTAPVLREDGRKHMPAPPVAPSELLPPLRAAHLETLPLPGRASLGTPELLVGGGSPVSAGSVGAAAVPFPSAAALNPPSGTFAAVTSPFPALPSPLPTSKASSPPAAESARTSPPAGAEEAVMVPFLEEASTWNRFPTEAWASSGDESTGWSAAALQTSAAVPLLKGHEPGSSLPGPILTKEGVQSLFDEPPRWVENHEGNALTELPMAAGNIPLAARHASVQLRPATASSEDTESTAEVPASSPATQKLPLILAGVVLFLLVGAYLGLFSRDVSVTITIEELPQGATVAVKGDPAPNEIQEWKHEVKLHEVTAYEFTVQVPGESVPRSFEHEINPHDDKTWTITLPPAAIPPILPNNP